MTERLYKQIPGWFKQKRAFRRVTYLLFVLLFGNSFVHGQQIQVVNHLTGTPVEHVALFNQSQKISTITNEQGETDLSVFEPGDTIYFQHPSFKLAHYKYSKLVQDEVVYLSKKTIFMDEFVISASKSRENIRHIPYEIEVLERRQMDLLNRQTAADLLRGTGNIFIQKSQGGGGSPILRGFEANKVLLVVDGVRMNNAIYRNGHLQNAITIDNEILDRVEVIFGPSSTIYGSDALGGVIHYYTRDPEFSKNQKLHFSGNAKIQAASVNRSSVYHLDVELGGKNISSLTSVTTKDFGDVRMGKNRSPFLGDFGKVFHYAGRINGEDTMLVNPDPHIQKNTGYRQHDFLQKLRLRITPLWNVTANVQYSTSSKVDRFEKLNDYADDGTLKYAEWYYGPQNRLLAALKNTYHRPLFFSDELTAIAAYQRIDEDRIKRKFDNPRKEHQEEDVHVYSLNLDILKRFNRKHKLNYGFEFTYNEVFSDAFAKNIISGAVNPSDTRYPDGGSYYKTTAGYINYQWKINPKYVFNIGTRYSHYDLHSTFSEENNAYPFHKIELNDGSVTGSASLVYHPAANWKISLLGSTGFRSPNVDDVGKVRVLDENILIPNNHVAPEYAYNGELGIEHTIEGYLRIDATAYNTYLTNAIVRSNHSFNGNDSILYKGDTLNVQTNTNVEEALVQGISLGLITDFSKDLIIRGSINYCIGKNLSTGNPLGHIPPLFGQLNMKYNYKKLQNEIYIHYNGWKYAHDFSPAGEDKPSEATRHGYPAWSTVNYRINYSVTSAFNIQFAIENIFDAYYKPYASAVSGPGRNFMVSLLARF